MRRDPSQSELVAQLGKHVERGREHHIAALRELIVAQVDGEKAIQTLVARRGADHGCEVLEVPFSAGQISLGKEFAAPETLRKADGGSVALRLTGTGDGRSLLLWAHYDLAPLPESLTWTHDPFAGDVEDGRIHGWGVADDLGGVAVLREMRFEPRGDVVLCTTISKQNSQGIVSVLNASCMANASLDAALHRHPAESGAGLREIQTASVGLVTFRVRVSGQSPPTSEPSKTAFAHLGTNAIHKAAVVTRALEDLGAERARRVCHPAMHEAVGMSTNLLISHVHGGSAEALDDVPTEHIVGASLTFPPSESLAAVRQQVERCVRGRGGVGPMAARTSTDVGVANRRRVDGGAHRRADLPIGSRRDSAGY